MRDAGVIYPGIPEKPGQMAISFKTQEKLETAAYLRVLLPDTFGAQCNDGDWNPISLPAKTSCNSDAKKNYLEVTINQTLVPGMYALTVLAIPPASGPESNIFSLLVLNKDREVADAAMNLPGYEIRHGIKMVGTELIWSNSEMGKLTVISLGFKLLEMLPEKDPPEIAEILITCPDDFEHTVKTPRDITGMSPDLPLEEGNDWLDIENVKYIRIKLDKEKTKTLRQGTYSFVFPALIPQPLMPPRNFWTLSVCRSSKDGCRSMHDEAVIVTFPFAGFQYGDVNPKSLRQAAGALPGAGFCKALLYGLISFSLEGVLW
jgi:hypothetical protein